MGQALGAEEWQADGRGTLFSEDISHYGQAGDVLPRCPFLEGPAAQLWVCGQQRVSSCQLHQGQL